MHTLNKRYSIHCVHTLNTTYTRPNTHALPMEQHSTLLLPVYSTHLTCATTTSFGACLPRTSTRQYNERHTNTLSTAHMKPNTPNAWTVAPHISRSFAPARKGLVQEYSLHTTRMPPPPGPPSQRGDAGSTCRSHAALSVKAMA